uniref:PDZ domain-containing protein n=1 Tax=Gouania willdenowi TaxID=441366 RepID=A0A8C5E599_GOUWI
ISFIKQSLTAVKHLDHIKISFSIVEMIKGVYVNMIRPDGPADRAGLRPYDRILPRGQIRPFKRKHELLCKLPNNSVVNCC